MKKNLLFLMVFCFTILANSSYCESEKILVKIGKQSFTIKDFEQRIDPMQIKTQNLNSDMKKDCSTNL